MNYMTLDEYYEAELDKRKKEIRDWPKDKKEELDGEEIVNRLSGQERGE
jgi:hypothetical protein